MRFDEEGKLDREGKFDGEGEGECTRCVGRNELFLYRIMRDEARTAFVLRSSEALVPVLVREIRVH